MAKLTSLKRHSLPNDEFALPTVRKYPIDTRARAANAKARASQQHARGNLSAAQEQQIDRRADRKLKSR